jgi:hypothetical protein
MRLAGRYRGDFSGRKQTLLATDPELECPGKHLETLFLVGMDVGGGHVAAGSGEQVALEEFATRVRSDFPPDHSFPGDGMFENVS